MRLFKKSEHQLEEEMLENVRHVNPFQNHVDSITGAFRYCLKSFRVRVFLLIVVIAWVPFLLLNEYIANESRTIQIEQKVSELQYQVRTLSRQMSRADYLSNVEIPAVNSALNAEIGLLSDLYDGRILVIGDSFRIVKDTYSTDTDKYNIS